MSPSSSSRSLGKLARLARKWPLFASLRTRIVLLVLFAVLPALALLVYNAVKEAQNATLRAVRMTSARQDDLVESTRQLLATLAELPQVRERDAEACGELFADLLRLHHVYFDLGAADLSGNVFASATLSSPPANLSGLPYFQTAVSTGGFAVGEYAVDERTKRATLPFCYPVHDGEQNLLLMVYASIDLAWLTSVITELNLPPNSSLTVLDRFRVTLARYPDDSFVGEPLGARRPPPPGSSPTESDWMNRPIQEGTRLLHSRDGTWRLYGITRLGHFKDLPPARISIGIPIVQMLGSHVLFVGIVSILALAAAWYGGNIMILRRTNDLLRAAAELREGNLCARTGIPYGRGELARLAQAFDEMASALEEKNTERERARQELKELNVDLERRVAARTIELERSNEDLDQFASVASHDLQEPLRMVTNYLQLLQHRYSTQLDDKANEFIGFATDGAARMQQLIQDLLAYSRVTSKEHAFERVPCQEPLDQALSNLELAIQDAGATITHDPLPVVHGNASLLTQVFQNLIGNGIKFRGSAKPAIHIGARRQNGEWLLSIRDNGIGMAPKDFSRIFIIFQRLHGRETYPGTGIGLSLCKKIVERHGGRIWVESQPGEGACFFFTLPAPPDEPSSA